MDSADIDTDDRPSKNSEFEARPREANNMAEKQPDTLVNREKLEGAISLSLERFASYVPLRDGENGLLT